MEPHLIAIAQGKEVCKQVLKLRDAIDLINVLQKGCQYFSEAFQPKVSDDTTRDS